MLGAALALGGASLLGSGMGAAASAKATQMQIDWERERAKNAHQWEVEDLKAAGLNPVLSAGGSGAQTGSVSAPDTSAISNAIPNAVNSALSVYQAQNTKAQTNNVNADTGVKNQQAINLAAEKGNIEADTAKKLTEKNLITQQAEEIRNRIPLLQEQAAKVRSDRQLNEFEKKKILSDIERNIRQNEYDLWRMENEKDPFKPLERSINSAAKWFAQNNRDAELYNNIGFTKHQARAEKRNKPITGRNGYGYLK